MVLDGSRDRAEATDFEVLGGLLEGRTGPDIVVDCNREPCALALDTGPGSEMTEVTFLCSLAFPALSCRYLRIVGVRGAAKLSTLSGSKTL